MFITFHICHLKPMGREIKNTVKGIDTGNSEILDTRN